MTIRKKAITTLISWVTCIGFSVVTVQAQTPPHELYIYAGPQTVSPGQLVNVTIELTDFQGNSLNSQPVQLLYRADGVAKSLTGKVENGLVSFDVKAQNRTGMMNFSAQYAGTSSSIAPVMVVAGRPVGFSLQVKPTLSPKTVEILSEIITDEVENPVSDQNLISLDWIDSRGVRRSEFLQLTNGRINSNISCPVNYRAPLHIRAVLKNSKFLSSDLSGLCAEAKART